MGNYLEGLNQHEKMQVNNNIRTLSYSNKSGSYVNTFRFSESETDAHIMGKLKKFRELRKEGIPVMTEAIFENGCRADIVDLLYGCVYEILHTETREEARKKIGKYPQIFDIEFIKTGEEPIPLIFNNEETVLTPTAILELFTNTKKQIKIIIG